MGLFKRNPETVRANAAELIDDGEHIQALTCGMIGGLLAPGTARNFAVAATEHHLYVIRTHPMGLGAKLLRVEEKIPLRDAKFERVTLGFKVNDLEMTGQNGWKKETEELAGYVAAQSQANPQP